MMRGCDFMHIMGLVVVHNKIAAISTQGAVGGVSRGVRSYCRITNPQIQWQKRISKETKVSQEVCCNGAVPTFSVLLVWQCAVPSANEDYRCIVIHEGPRTEFC